MNFVTARGEINHQEPTNLVWRSLKISHGMTVTTSDLWTAPFRGYGCTQLGGGRGGGIGSTPTSEENTSYFTGVPHCCYTCRSMNTFNSSFDQSTLPPCWQLEQRIRCLTTGGAHILGRAGYRKALRIEGQNSKIARNTPERNENKILYFFE